MKILQISERYSSNIADIYNTTFKALQILSSETVIHAYLRDKVAISNNTKTKHHFFKFSKRMLKGSKKLLLLPTIYNFCKKNAIDVVVTHRHKACYLIALTSIFYPFKKKIAVFHGIGEFDKFSFKLFGRFFLKNFTIVAVSEAVQKDLLECKAGFSPQQVKLIYNAVDIKQIQKKQFEKNTAREKLSITSSSFVYGQIARLVPLKGQITLIHAFAKCAIPGAQLVIIGEGRHRRTIEQEICSLKLENKVHLLGAIPDAYKYVKAFDVFVLSSTKEGFGLVLIEAAAGKIPLIATSAGGIKEVMSDESSRLVQPNNIEDLANEMLKIYHHDHISREKYIMNQYNNINAKFNLNTFITRWAEVIRDAHSNER